MTHDFEIFLTPTNEFRPYFFSHRFTIHSSPPIQRYSSYEVQKASLKRLGKSNLWCMEQTHPDLAIVKFQEVGRKKKKTQTGTDFIYIYEGVQWKSKLQHTERWSAAARPPRNTHLSSSSRCAFIPAKEEFSSMLLFQSLFCFIKSVRLKSRNLKLPQSVTACVVKIHLILYMPIGRDVRAMHRESR